MTDKKMLIGSLSNDLYRVANLIQRGSLPAAEKFLDQADRWVTDLKQYEVKYHIGNIIYDLRKKPKKLDMEIAEKYLMYSILLQNYALHME